MSLCSYIVSGQDPILGHSMEDFAALIPHDNPHQLPVMEVRASIHVHSVISQITEISVTLSVSSAKESMH